MGRWREEKKILIIQKKKGKKITLGERAKNTKFINLEEGNGRM